VRPYAGVEEDKVRTHLGKEEDKLRTHLDIEEEKLRTHLGIEEDQVRTHVSIDEDIVREDTFCYRGGHIKTQVIMAEDRMRISFRIHSSQSHITIPLQ
jgi:hypothetical protein